MIKNFQCQSCGANYSLAESGMSATSVYFEEIGGAGTSGSKDVTNWPEAQKLKDEWKVLGLNNHEEASLTLGYDTIVSEYIKLKLRILASRDKKGTPEAKKNFYEGLRIYIYTVYENLFFGYMISYASNQNSAFMFRDKCKKFGLDQQYYNHLPSFSSALLHFGNCRDLIFVLVRLANKGLLNNADEYGQLINKHYSKKNFLADLKILSNDNPAYVDAGEKFFELHMFRNIYEHKFRLLWWKNKAAADDNLFFVKKDLYYAIKKVDNNKQITDMLFEILKNPQKYENEIFNSDLSEIISSRQILHETHDKMATFFNDTLIHISNRI